MKKYRARERDTRGERNACQEAQFAYDREGATRLSIKCILPSNYYSICSKLCTESLIASIACLFVEKLIFERFVLKPQSL